MGRELRMVPATWEHPVNENGHHIPLLSDNYAQRLYEWTTGRIKWHNGLREDWENKGCWIPKEPDENCTWEEWDGKRPRPEDYMPDWPKKYRTHFQMYEDTTEGTPISPVMDTAEGLAQWLVDNDASSFGYMTATYDQWLSTIQRGWAVSAVLCNGTMISGVAGLSE